MGQTWSLGNSSPAPDVDMFSYASHASQEIMTSFDKVLKSFAHI